MAKRQVELITGSPETKIYFRLIHDVRDNDAIKLYGSVGELWSLMTVKQGEGYGVFFVVNEGGDRDEDITGICAVFVDGDDKPMPKPGEWHQMPSFTVRRNAIRWHGFWVVKGLSVEEFRSTQLRLASHYGTDTTVCNLSRVMRLAGTLHLKDPSQPFLMELEDDEMCSWDLCGPFVTHEVHKDLPQVADKLREKRKAAPGAELDHERIVTMAGQYLDRMVKEERVAIEGKGGDAFTLQMCNNLLDQGCTPPTAFELMRDRFNGHCQPPWDHDELEAKVANAATYRENEIGCDAIDTRPLEVIFAKALANVRAAQQGGARTTNRLVSRRGSELTPKKIEWTWPQRFPRAQLSLLAGHGGGGKTTMLVDMAARITRGAQWPDGSGAAKRGSVVYFSAEDATEQTLLPRFMAADGDRDKVHFVTAVKREDGNGVRSFHLQDDLRELEGKVAEIGDVELVVFDPISSYFGRTDTYRNSEVRSVLEPVAEFADRCGVTILGNTHFAKGSKAPASMRILDSVAMSAVARACYVVVEDADNPDRRLFLSAKANLTKRQDGLAFTIAQKHVAEDVFGSHVVWESTGVAQTADEALGAMDSKDRPETAVDAAAAFLQAYLADGPRPVPEVSNAASERDITERTLKRAKTKLRVEYKKSGMDGGWVVFLPRAREIL